jgi:integrase
MRTTINERGCPSRIRRRHLARDRGHMEETECLLVECSACAYTSRASERRPATLNTNGRTAVSGWTRAKRSLDTLSGVTAWRLHDIRRTVATGLQRLGMRLEVIEAVLGHVSGSRAGIVGLYQRHAFEPEKRAALEAWGAHVARITANKHRTSSSCSPTRRVT